MQSRTPGGTTAILATNRQIYEEAMLVLYGNGTANVEIDAASIDPCEQDPLLEPSDEKDNELRARAFIKNWQVNVSPFNENDYSVQTPEPGEAQEPACEEVLRAKTVLRAEWYWKRIIRGMRLCRTTLLAVRQLERVTFTLPCYCVTQFAPLDEEDEGELTWGYSWQTIAYFWTQALYQLVAGGRGPLS
ncbi:MAG: hypothetical protein Q9218_008028, partial [Villophora microphyllina]